jgi:DNA gyrase subunit A
MGRQARGVRGIRLAEGDTVVGCDIVREGRQSLLVSKKGIGKRTEFSEFTPHHRGTAGVRALPISDKTGPLIGSWGVSAEDEIILMTNHGRVVRIEAGDISVLGRGATGYRVIRLDEGDTVADVSVIHVGEEEEE